MTFMLAKIPFFVNQDKENYAQHQITDTTYKGECPFSAISDNFPPIQVILNESTNSESKDVEKMEIKQRVRRCILV